MSKKKLSLQETHPEIAKQWHPTKNGELSPNDVVAGSHKRAWWKCDKGSDHQWSTVVKSRALREGGCPYCSGKKVSITNSLVVLYPEIAKQWHPTKNGDLTPDSLVSGSNKKVWWKCDKGPDHEWQAVIQKRTLRGDGCPYCAGQRVSETNSLATLCPEVAFQWHPTKNGELSPNDVVSGSKKKVWWKCDKGPDHEWQASTWVKNRSYQTGNSGCPYCRGFRVSETNSLAVLYPEIAKQWHPTKNEELVLDDMVSSSAKKVWWKCEAGVDHEWQAKIYTRVKGHGCPYCAGQRVSETNSLAVLYPEIATQWHSTKNGELGPNDVVARSNKKVWWKCEKGPDHEWQASPGEIIRSYGTDNTGCPYCRGFRVSETNSLAVLYPEVAAQWHSTKNGELSPKDVVTRSNKKVWWKCDKGPDHEWKTSPDHRVRGYGCPYCSGNKVSITNSLAVLYPEIAKQWHPTKNGESEPRQFTTKSGKKVWWKCNRGADHEWESRVADRTFSKSGCPYCTLNGTSQIEIKLRFELKNFVDYDIYDNKLKISEDKSYQVDIKIPSVKLIVEYDGTYYHADSRRRDEKKTQDLQNEGWKVIRIRSEELGAITDNDVILSLRDTKLPKIVMEHLLHKLALFGYLDMSAYEDYRKRDSLISGNEANAYIEKLLKPLRASEINENQLNDQLLFEID